MSGLSASLKTTRRAARLFGLAAAVMATVWAGAGAAIAGPAAPLASAPAAMPLGTASAPPSGFLDFCERSPRDCEASGEAVDLAEVRDRANALHWAGVFGRGERQTPVRPASTSETLDWRRLSQQAASERSHQRSGRRSQPLSPHTGSAPIGQGAAAAWSLSLSDADWKAVSAINRQVNREIRSGSDARVHGVDDYWSIPTGDRARGDCEDYVLAKRRALIRAGYPVQSLSIAVVDTRWGETHAVLLISTDRGEFVLDNLTSRISRWDEVSYRWRERQVPGKTFEWVRMG